MLNLNRACLVRRYIGASTVLVIGLAAAFAVADPPDLRIDWSVNGGLVNTAWPKANEPQGFTYDGTTTDLVTGIELSYSLTADPYASLGGNIGVFNHLVDAVDLSVVLVMEFTPVFVDGSDLAGQVTIGLTTGAGGGQIQSQRPGLWQAVIDNVVVGPAATLFHHPFIMSNSGMGSSATHADFGIPFPVPGPPITSNLGYALNFTLTSLDTVSITSSFIASGEALTCQGDLNLSAAVDTDDFLALLSDWGPCAEGPCDADLDGDGVVGISDMLELLANWGPCPLS